MWFSSAWQVVLSILTIAVMLSLIAALAGSVMRRRQSAVKHACGAIVLLQFLMPPLVPFSVSGFPAGLATACSSNFSEAGNEPSTSGNTADKRLHDDASRRSTSPVGTKKAPTQVVDRKAVAAGDKLELPPEADPLLPIGSPNQQFIAFVGSMAQPDVKPQHGLFVYNVTTKVTRRLLDKALKTRPAWSPDSQKIAIGNSSSYVTVYPLVIVDVKTGVVDATGAQGAGAAWSPNGRLIAVSTQFAAGGSWIAGVPVDGRIGVWDTVERKFVVISPAGVNQHDRDGHYRFMSGGILPDWSPDGSWLAWQQRVHEQAGSERKTPRSEIWVARPDGSGLRRVFQQSTEIRWSPDGTSLTDVSSNTTTKIADVAEATPQDWPTMPMELTQQLAQEQASRERAAAFRADDVLAANRLWQNPTLDGITSLEFTHRMLPSRVDERFIWSRDGGTSVEVTHCDGKTENKQIEPGWLKLCLPDGGRFKFLNSQAYPHYASPADVLKANSSQRLRPLTATENFRRETLRHLSGTRLNFTAIDWGRNPGDYIVTDYSQAGEVHTVELRPQRDAYRDCVLNAGAMFEVISNAYVHDIRIQRAVLTIDAKQRITREVTYQGDAVVGEVELLDWGTTAAGQQAPQRIHLSFPGHKFRVEQKFRVTDKGLWILESGCSWFEGHEPITEEIVDLKINASDGEVNRQITKAQQRLQEMSAVAKNASTIQLQGLTPLELGATYSFPARPETTRDHLRPQSLTFKPVAAPRHIQLHAELRFPPKRDDDLNESGDLLLVLYDARRQPQLATTIPEAAVAAAATSPTEILSPILKQHQLWLRNGTDPVPEAAYTFHHSDKEIKAVLPSKQEHVAKGITLNNALTSFRAAPEQCRAPIAIAADWNGRPVKIVGLTGGHFKHLFGSGLSVNGGYSGSYNSSQPSSVLLVVDATTGFPLVERSDSMEFQYLDYVEAAPGQFAPLRILCRTDHMQVDLRFQILNGRLWLFDRMAVGKPAPSVFINDILIEGKAPTSRVRSETADPDVVPPEFPWHELKSRRPDRAGDLFSAKFAEYEQPWRHSGWELLGQLQATTAPDQGRLLQYTLPRWPTPGRITHWTLTRISAVGAESLQCPETLPVGEATQISAIPLVFNIPQLLPPLLETSPAADSKTLDVPETYSQIRVRQITVTREPRNGITVVPEILNTARYTEQSARVSVVFLTPDGISTAGGHGLDTLRALEGPAASSAMRIPLIHPHSEANQFVLTGCRSIVTLVPVGSLWGTMGDADKNPTLTPALLLSSRFPLIREVGIKSLYGDRNFFFSEQDEIQSRKQSRKQREMTGILAPYHNELLAIMSDRNGDTVESLAITCRLAGLSGNKDFIAPLRERLHHETEQVRDSAVIGLGLLKQPDGLRRLQELATKQASEVLEEDAFQIRNRWHKEVKWALMRLAE